MNHKKAFEGTPWMLAMIVVTLVVLFIISGIFTKLLGQSSRGVSSQIDSAGDFDGDGVINLQDKCPCIIKGSIEFDGCNSNRPTDDEKKRDCLEKK